MARIRTQVTIPAYMNASRPRTVEAYLTKADSRFAVAKVTDKHWSLRHIKSGLAIDSLLPPKSFTLNQLLSAVKAIEAHTELDLSTFDEAQFGKGFDRLPPQEVTSALRTIVTDAVS